MPISVRIKLRSLLSFRSLVTTFAAILSYQVPWPIVFSLIQDQALSIHKHAANKNVALNSTSSTDLKKKENSVEYRKGGGWLLQFCSTVGTELCSSRGFSFTLRAFHSSLHR